LHHENTRAESGGSSFSSVSSEQRVLAEKDQGKWREEPSPAGRGEDLPGSPADVVQHPDVCAFATVTGGRIPGLNQYHPVIEAFWSLREKKKLDDRAWAVTLPPAPGRYTPGRTPGRCGMMWQAWSGRRRQDGQSYEPGNVSRLTDWALNRCMPGEKKEVADVAGMVE